MKKPIKMLAILLAAMSALCGCGQPTPAKTFRLSDDSMRLVAYATPPNGNTDGAYAPFGKEPNFNTEEHWRTLADVGYNCAIPIWHDYTNDHILATLQNAEKQGIKVIIEDRVSPGLPNIIRSAAKYSFEETTKLIEMYADGMKARYDTFKEYDSFLGIVAMDEPSVEYYEALAAGMEWWRNNYPEYEFYCNLFPSYSQTSQLFGSGEQGTHKEYVERYINAVNPDYISYDFYPLRRQGLSGIIHPSWLTDLETFATLSSQYDIPFYIYFLTTQHLSFSAINYYREVAWQCYSAMAYGVRGLQSFMYWSYMIPDENMNNLGTSLVDPHGVPQPTYYAVQEVFAEIDSFDELYMGFEWEKTMPVGLSGSGTFSGLINKPKSLDGLQSVAAEKDALIGQFRDKNGNLAYMVTNYTSPFNAESNTVELTFENAQRVLVCKKGRQIVETVKNGKLVLQMGCGEGFFVVPL